MAGALLAWAGAPPASAQTATQLVSSAYHTCALMTTSRAVQCWGDNEFGQLGNGLTSRSPTPAPVAVVGLGGDGGSGDTNGGE